ERPSGTRNRRGEHRPREAVFRRCNPLRFLHHGPNAMKPGRAVRDLVAVFADLKFAVTIGSANYQFGFTFFVGRPLVAPETPAQLGSRFSNLGGIPRFTVVTADLHFQDPAVATESHPAQFDRLPNLERRFEVVAPNLRRVEATVRSEERRVGKGSR